MTFYEITALASLRLVFFCFFLFVFSRAALDLEFSQMIIFLKRDYTFHLLLSEMGIIVTCGSACTTYVQYNVWTLAWRPIYSVIATWIIITLRRSIHQRGINPWLRLGDKKLFRYSLSFEYVPKEGESTSKSHLNATGKNCHLLIKLVEHEAEP